MFRFSVGAFVLAALVAGCSSSNGGPTASGAGAPNPLASGGVSSSSGAPGGGAGSGAAGSGGVSPGGGTAGGGSGAAGGGSSSSGAAAGGGPGASGGSSSSSGGGSSSSGGGKSSGGTSAAVDGGTVAADAGGSAAGVDSGYVDPGNVGDGDFVVGPTYTPSPDLTLKANAPAGFQYSFTMTSAMSTIFNGSDFTPPLTFSRTITVWIPDQYVDGTASPFMVTSDGFYVGIKTVVQNLAGNTDPNNSVPALTVIGIQNGPDVHPNSERSLEYDTVSDRYWRFVTQEVIPMALANAQLKAKFPNFQLTSDPDGRGGYGCSSGGPAVMGLACSGTSTVSSRFQDRSSRFSKRPRIRSEPGSTRE